jgi:ATP/maltotriose-dependent transcriptional regulator MalT
LPAARSKVVGFDRERDGVNCRIKVAWELAVANSVPEALTVLSEVRPAIRSTDKKLSALFFQAYAIAKIKSLQLDEAFNAFEHALAIARAEGDLPLRIRILNNYGTAETLAGNVQAAIAHLEEALAEQRRLGSFAPVIILSLAQATFASGYLERTRLLLREFYAVEDKRPFLLSCSGPRLLASASALAIPTAIMLQDPELLRMSNDTSLMDLVFASREQSLIGSLVEAFCILFEHEQQRAAHDALLARCIDSLQSLDDSLSLGLRIARLGSARHIPRISALMSRQCAGSSDLLKAYKALFESFIAARRGMLGQSKELAGLAAKGFSNAGRPLQEALALESAGFLQEADLVRIRCGVRTELAGGGWVGDPLSRQLAEALTSRETQIAKLAAQGLTNRSIAEQLGISQRTVQHHCESIFCKLGIRSRWQLSEASVDVLNDLDGA